MGTIHKIGRRKCAVARVYVTEGSGNITVNKREFSNYFPTATLQYKVLQPLTMTNNENNFDVKINVYGGGATGQAEAVRMAIARAMCEVEAFGLMFGDLGQGIVLMLCGWLLKKFGQKKARKRFQFSKR